MATIAPARDSAFTFWQKMALGLAVFVLFSFVQSGLRNLADLRAVPVWEHLLAAVIVGWLSLFVTQPTLVRRGLVAQHRQLGGLALGVAGGLVLLFGFSAVMAVRDGAVPSFFAPSYFLALNAIGIAGFVALLGAAAMTAGKDLEAHRRYIVGANVLLLEPALDRLLPMPLMAPWGEFAVMLVQLGVLGLLARHDLRTLGTVHRATLAGMATVAILHSFTEMVGRLPAMQAIAAGIAAS